MKSTTLFVLLAALAVCLCAGCGKTDEVSVPEQATLTSPPEPATAPAREEPTPVKVLEPVVPKAEIEKAARFYAVLHAPMSDDERDKAVDAAMDANGWTAESYQALLYNIAQDPPSRAFYLSLAK